MTTKIKKAGPSVAKNDRVETQEVDPSRVQITTVSSSHEPAQAGRTIYFSTRPKNGDSSALKD